MSFTFCILSSFEALFWILLSSLSAFYAPHTCHLTILLFCKALLFERVISSMTSFLIVCHYSYYYYNFSLDVNFLDEKKGVDRSSTVIARDGTEGRSCYKQCCNNTLTVDVSDKMMRLNLCSTTHTFSPVLHCMVVFLKQTFPLLFGSPYGTEIKAELKVDKNRVTQL